MPWEAEGCCRPLNMASRWPRALGGRGGGGGEGRMREGEGDIKATASEPYARKHDHTAFARGKNNALHPLN